MTGERQGDRGLQQRAAEATLDLIEPALGYHVTKPNKLTSQG